MRFGMLVLETHSYCNRRCKHCIRQTDPGSKRFVEGAAVRALVPIGTVESMLRQAKQMGFSGPVSLYYFSEPFFDDRIIHFAKLARKFGMRPRVATNGDVLRKDSALAKACSVFSIVQVSLYAANDAAAVARAKAYWRQRLPCPVVFQVPAAIGDRPHLPPGAFGQRRTYPTSVCRRPIEKLIVQYDGSLPICCFDAGAEIVPGNAFEIGLAAAWESTQRMEAIEDLRLGKRQKYPLCEGCPMPPRKPRKRS
jgi:hypothetical protein